MATTRLTFLYPQLFRLIRVSDPAAQTVRRAHKPQWQSHNSRGISTSEREQTYLERHGKAIEPGSGKELPDISKDFVLKEGGADVEKGKTWKKKKHGAQNDKINQAKTEPSTGTGVSDEAKATTKLSTEAVKGGEDGKAKSLEPRQQEATKAPLAPIETILRMPPPQSMEAENDDKPPHLQTPPYVHHFDTYTLVQQVEAGGFTSAQSITAMKAVRSLLTHNLDIAKAGLVSESDVENESYLFRAACSELKMEVQNTRRTKDEEMRRERTILQHEADILNQKLTQELLTLKDDMKGMFDDRKMSVRTEQRAMESKIQELNYKITVLLNSDSKSEIEGLRWVLTRRSVMGILFMALMVLTSLRYAKYRTREEEVRKKKEGEKVEESVADRSMQGAAEVLAANGG